jgi:hypothetical protein
LDNLKWSGKAILNSITLPLWETVEKDLRVDRSGPEAFAAVVYKLQQVSSEAVRTLVDELKSLSLLKEPGQDAEIFGGWVVELCRRISGTGSAPTNLVVLAAATFLECNVLAFKLKAIKVHDEVEDNPRAMTWDAVVRTLKTKYQSLKGQGLWTPQATSKKKDDELSGLHAAITKLSVQVGGAGSKNGGGGPCCYGCGDSDISQETVQRLAPRKGLLVRLPKRENPTQRRSMEPPSRGATFAAVGQLGKRSTPLGSMFVALIDPTQDRTQLLLKHQLLPQLLLPHRHGLQGQSLEDWQPTMEGAFTSKVACLWANLSKQASHPRVRILAYALKTSFMCPADFLGTKTSLTFPTDSLRKKRSKRLIPLWIVWPSTENLGDGSAR